MVIDNCVFNLRHALTKRVFVTDDLDCLILHEKLPKLYFGSLFSCKLIDDSHLCHFFR
jgi:hypothetical protein